MRKWWLLVSAGLLLFGGLAIVGWWVISSLANAPRSFPIPANISSLTFTKDGKLLALGTQAGGAQLWRVSDGQLLRRFGITTDIVRGIAFSPDGQILAVGRGQNLATQIDTPMLELWRVADGTLLRSWPAGGRVAFSPDGSLVASSNVLSGDQIGIWRANDGTSVRFLPAGHPTMDVAFSPDGQILAVGTTDGVQLWHVADGALLRTLPGWADSIALAPDGQTIAAPVDVNGGSVGLWRTVDGARIKTFRGLTNQVHSVAFTPDGQTLAAADNEGNVRLWQVATSTVARVMTLKSGNFLGSGLQGVDALGFTPDGQSLAIGGYQTVQLWPLR